MTGKKQDSPFQAFDLEASFCEGSKGRAVHRVIGHDGAEKLNRTVWDAGLIAYEYLGGTRDGMDNLERYRECVSLASSFLNDTFAPDLMKGVHSDHVGLSEGTPKDFEEAWKDYDWVEKLDIFLQSIDHANARSGNDTSVLVGEQFKPVVAAALLRRIDDAIISDFFDGDGLIENVVDIVELRDRIKPSSTQKLTIDAAIGADRKKIGRTGAAARLAKDPKQADKQNVRDCWERWQKNRHEYKSKSAFARAMLEKYENLESHRVIERWCKEWESEPS